MATTSYRQCCVLAVAFGCTALLLAFGGRLSAEELFRDDFNGSISTDWDIVRKDASYSNVQPTALDLRACRGNLWQSMNDAKNVFLIKTPTTGDFTVTMRVDSFVPSAMVNAPQFDILAYDDDANFIRCGYGSVPVGGRGHARGFEFASEVEDRFTASGTAVDCGTGPFLLRLVKTGNVYTQLYSTDGATFHQANSPITFGDGTPTWLGFVALGDPNESSHVHVDYFEVVSVLVPTPFSLAATDGEPATTPETAPTKPDERISLPQQGSGLPNSTSNVVYLGKAPQWTLQIGPASHKGLLGRELIRQALLIAARDELRLTTRDAWLGDAIPTDPQNAPLDVAAASGMLGLFRGSSLRVDLAQYKIEIPYQLKSPLERLDYGALAVDAAATRD